MTPDSESTSAAKTLSTVLAVMTGLAEANAVVRMENNSTLEKTTVLEVELSPLLTAKPASVLVPIEMDWAEPICVHVIPLELKKAVKLSATSTSLTQSPAACPLTVAEPRVPVVVRQRN